MTHACLLFQSPGVGGETGLFAEELVEVGGGLETDGFGDGFDGVIVAEELFGADQAGFVDVGDRGVSGVADEQAVKEEGAVSGDTRQRVQVEFFGEMVMDVLGYRIDFLLLAA